MDNKIKKLEIKNLKKLKAILGLTTVLTITTLTGCDDSRAVTDDATEIYTTIDSNDGQIDRKPQTIDVEGEDFKLIVENYVDKTKKWKITDNKELYSKIHTKDLPANTKVWIDNIHADTYIVATDELMNGIKQDSMDDHSHSTEVLGFRISDDITYHGSFGIEGQNDNFIKGSFYGFEGYESGSVKEERRTEEDYLAATVYANKITSIYDLWVQKDDEEPYMTVAKSDILVLASNEITKINDEGTVEKYRYDRNGNYEVIDLKTKVKNNKRFK